ncbi:alpha/beta fold hydrolase [Myxococcota bacterium]|nr:alpha/beta fold hydrolase [Myxococcota bacterium]
MDRSNEPRAVAIGLREEDWALEGAFTAGSDPAGRGAVIAPPHPLYGGSMHAPVVTELAWACTRVGLSTLCFDWRGVGGSGGTPSGETLHADSDYEGALSLLAETVSGGLFACGYSWGAATAVRIALEHPRVDGAVLVAPPPSMMDESKLAAFTGPMLVVVGERDDLAPHAGLEACLVGRAATELVLVPDADHFFATGAQEIGRAFEKWFEARR